MEPLRFEDVLDAVHAVREPQNACCSISGSMSCRGGPALSRDFVAGGVLRLECAIKNGLSESAVFLFAPFGVTYQTAMTVNYPDP